MSQTPPSDDDAQDPYDAGRHVGVKLNPGDRVAGRFQIIRQLGRGGFGRVYEARQESMGQRRIALKVLAPRNAREPNAEGRFKQEALLASRLSHPNTITLFDYGATEAGLFYIAMEYLEGETLGTVLRRGALSVERAEHVTLQVLRSLAEAHSIGLIHRDLKPDNIYLCQIFGERDFVKVLDFGLAKIAGVLEERAAKGQLPWNARTDLTLEGLVCGTPEYMAPEQARGIEPLGPSCDVYAVGLLIYNMLTGAKPYLGATPMEILQKQVNDPLPALAPALVGARVARLMEVATRKNPEDRYPDASAMLFALMGRLPMDPLSPAEALPALPAGLSRVKTQQFVPLRRATAPSLRAMDGPQGSFAVEVNIEASRVAPLLDEPQLTQDAPRETERFALPMLLQEEPAEPLEPVTGSLPAVDPDATNPGLSLALVEAIDGLGGLEQLGTLEEDVETSAPAMLSAAIPMVGRDEELRQLLGVVRSTAQQRRSRVVLIKGDPGVGKSRLLAEVVRIVHDTSDVLVAGSFFRDPNAAPLDGLRRMLSHILGLDPDVADAMGDAASLEAVLRANLEQRQLTIPESELRLLASVLSPEEGRRRSEERAAPSLILFRLRRLLLDIARQQPLFLILEDIQFADPASLELIRRLVHAIARPEEDRPAPALCLTLTLRRETSTDRKDLLELVQLLGRYEASFVDTIALQGLSDEACSQLLDALLPLGPELRRRVTEAAHGNPLHAMEVVRHMVQDHRLVQEAERFQLDPASPEELSLPDDVAEMMRLRLGHVVDMSEAPEALQELLYRLAVLGRRVPLELLRAALELEDRPWPLELVEVLLGELMAQGLLHLDTGRPAAASATLAPLGSLLHTPGSLSFEHGLLHEILLREAEGTVAARRLHRKAARAKQRFYDAGRTELATELAQHLLRAQRPAEALPYLVEAAAWSQQAGDLQGALARFADADRLLAHPELQGAASPRLIHQIGLALGQLHLRLGRLGPAQHYLERTAASCAQRTDLDDPTLARVHLAFAELAQHQKRFEDARAHLEEARSLGEQCVTPAVDVVQKALIQLGELRLAEEGALPADYVRSFEARLELATAELPLLKARGLQHLGNVALAQGDPLDAERFLARARLIVDEVGDPSIRAPIIADLGHALLLQGNTAQGEGYLRQALAGYRELGDRLGLAACLHRLGLAAWLRADPAEALRLLDEALLTRDELGLNGHAAETLELMGRIHEAEGRLPQARDAYEASLRAHDKRRPGFDASLRMRLGSTLLKLGDLDAAYRHLESARSWLETRPEATELVPCLNLLAMIASWQEHIHHAARLFGRSAAIAREGQDASGEAFALAALALIVGRHPDASAGFDPPEALLAQARAVRERHDLPALQPLLDAAWALLQRRPDAAPWDALPPLHRAWIEHLCRTP